MRPPTNIREPTQQPPKARFARRVRARQGPEREGQILRGLKALFRPLLQTPAHNAIQRRRDQPRILRQILRIFFQNRRHGFGGGVAVKRPLPRNHFIQHRTEREDVGARIHSFASHLLRRHVAGGAHHHASHRGRTSDGQSFITRTRRIRLR